MKAEKQKQYDTETMKRAEFVAKIFSEIPSDKETFFLTIANAYLDGLIAGQSLNESAEQ